MRVSLFGSMKETFPPKSKCDKVNKQFEHKFRKEKTE